MVDWFLFEEDIVCWKIGTSLSLVSMFIQRCQGLASVAIDCLLVLWGIMCHHRASIDILSCIWYRALTSRHRPSCIKQVLIDVLVECSEGRHRGQWMSLQMAVRFVADGSEGHCRWQWGTLQISVRVVVDGSEGLCRWQWGTLQISVRVVADGSEGRCGWQWGSL